MAISTRKKRKIVVGQRLFLWWVVDDDDSADWVLRVVSEDKQFSIRYHLGQPDEERFLIVLGREFPDLPQSGSCWLRVLCPRWEQNSVISSGCVHRLIDWCLHQERNLVQVDYLGKPIQETEMAIRTH